ncbi:MAG TPA: hypothetical protein VG126_10850, partial [Thermoleophilaceae bacterium]|nr:hypothetical protein [Thermoleophilaceae bacterium]
MPVRATHLLLAVALLGLAAEAQARTFQLERGRLTGAVRVVEDRAAVGGRAVAVTGPGSVRRRFATGHGFSALVLRARALPCAGRRPRIALRVDGRRIGTQAVRSRGFAGLRFRVGGVSGPRTAELRLANPMRGRSCRRTAVVDSLRVVERRGPSSSPLGATGPGAGGVGAGVPAAAAP